MIVDGGREKAPHLVVGVELHEIVDVVHEEKQENEAGLESDAESLQHLVFFMNPRSLDPEVRDVPSETVVAGNPARIVGSAS